MEIRLIRHGEAEVKGKDSILTELGKKQSKKLADYLNTLDIDYVISSTLTRAKQTASYYLKLNPNVDYESLREANEIYRILIGGDKKPGTRPNREKEDKERADQFLEYLKSLDCSCIAIFTHGNLIRYIISKLKNKDPKSYGKSAEVFPASITEIISNKITKINSIKHLGNLAKDSDYAD